MNAVTLVALILFSNVFTTVIGNSPVASGLSEYTGIHESPINRNITNYNLSFNATYFNPSGQGLNNQSDNIALNLTFNLYNPKNNLSAGAVIYNITLTRIGVDGANITLLNDLFLSVPGSINMIIQQPSQQEKVIIEQYSSKFPSFRTTVNTPNGTAVFEWNSLIYNVRNVALTGALMPLAQGSTPTLYMKTSSLLEPGWYHAHVEIFGLENQFFISSQIRKFDEGWVLDKNLLGIPEFQIDTIFFPMGFLFAVLTIFVLLKSHTKLHFY